MVPGQQSLRRRRGGNRIGAGVGRCIANSTHAANPRLTRCSLIQSILKMKNCSATSIRVTVISRSVVIPFPRDCRRANKPLIGAGQYLDLFAKASDANGTPEDPLKVCGFVVRNCVRLLRLSYEQGLATDQANEIADLRHAPAKTDRAM